VAWCDVTKIVSECVSWYMAVGMMPVCMNTLLLQHTDSMDLAMASQPSAAIIRYCIDWRLRECCFHMIRCACATSSLSSAPRDEDRDDFDVM
jgi:hypothetical protein